MSTATPSPVRDASTVILLSPIEGEGGAFEVFMVKRHSKSAFMANAYVYPGGRLDDVDCSPEMAALTLGLDGEGCAKRLHEPLEPARARGLFVAALREAYEEAGVLFADPMPERARDGHWREALCAQTSTLVEMGEAEGVRFRLDALHPFAHWITPEVEPRRYDTWFFVARCPVRQRGRLRHDDRETVDSLWIRPEDALARYAEGGFQLAPPTFRTLETLASLEDIEAVLERCQTREVIPAIQPVITTGPGGGVALLLPGDPEHPATAEGVCVEGSPRIVLEDGRWWSKRPGE